MAFGRVLLDDLRDGIVTGVDFALVVLLELYDVAWLAGALLAWLAGALAVRRAGI